MPTVPLIAEEEATGQGRGSAKEGYKPLEEALGLRSE